MRKWEKSPRSSWPLPLLIYKRWCLFRGITETAVWGTAPTPVRLFCTHPSKKIVFLSFSLPGRIKSSFTYRSVWNGVWERLIRIVFHYYFGELCLWTARRTCFMVQPNVSNEHFPVIFEKGKLRFPRQTSLTKTNNQILLMNCFDSAMTRFDLIVCCVLVVRFTSSKQTKQSYIHVAWKHSCQCASVQLRSASYWQSPHSGRPVAPTWTTAWVSVSWESSPTDLC